MYTDYRRTVYKVVKVVSFCHIKVNHAQKCPHMFTILSPIPSYVHRRMAVCKKGKFSRATAQKRPWWSHSELESTFQRWGPSKEIKKYILDPVELPITKKQARSQNVFSVSSHTVNIYRYKAIGANATSSVILYTGKCISPCLEIL